MTYSKHLTAIDGMQPDIAENVREMMIQPDTTADDSDEEMYDHKKGQEVVKVTETLAEKTDKQ